MLQIAAISRLCFDISYYLKIATFERIFRLQNTLQGWYFSVRWIFECGAFYDIRVNVAPIQLQLKAFSHTLCPYIALNLRNMLPINANPCELYAARVLHIAAGVVVFYTMGINGVETSGHLLRLRVRFWVLWVRRCRRTWVLSKRGYTKAYI